MQVAIKEPTDAGRKRIRHNLYKAVKTGDSDTQDRIAREYGMKTTLKKADIIENKEGIYVSKKKSKLGKKIFKENDLKDYAYRKVDNRRSCDLVTDPCGKGWKCNPKTNRCKRTKGSKTK